MRFVFFGTPDFAEIVLNKMIEGGCKPDLVICNPDRPFGRKKIITPPPTKVLAKKYRIDVWQPEKLAGESFEEKVDGIDFAVVAAYAKLIPQKILNYPRLGTIGVHPSLLPKYRGASPIQSAILGGEKETGVTLYLMDEKLDHGPILAQRRTLIGHHENYLQLEKRLAEMGGDLLAETLPDFSSGKIKSKVQDHERATMTGKFKTDDAFINPKDLLAAENGDTKRAEEIFRKIRAFISEPGVWTKIEGKRTKILEADIKDQKLIIRKIQKDGERPKVVG